MEVLSWIYVVAAVVLEGQSRTQENLPAVSPGSKILVAVTGPVMNAVFAFALATALYFLGLPVRVNPAIIGSVQPGSAEATLGIRPGDRIVAVNGKPVMIGPMQVAVYQVERPGPLPWQLIARVTQRTFALDGGHIAMALLEKLRGRPLSPRVQEFTTMIFATLLISFIVYVSYNDLVKRWPLFKSMFDEQARIQSSNGLSRSPEARQ